MKGENGKLAVSYQLSAISNQLKISVFNFQLLTAPKERQTIGRYGARSAECLQNDVYDKS